jgi:hypothetical protein
MCSGTECLPDHNQPAKLPVTQKETIACFDFSAQVKPEEGDYQEITNQNSIV